MPCPVCQSEEVSKKIHQFTYYHKPYTLSECKACDCWFYDPFPHTDYTAELNTDISLRHYLETSANIENLTRIADNFYCNYIHQGKIGLEIGCGFGFISHYLTCLYHQKMTAYEPSEYGMTGKEMLQVNIVRDYFSAADHETGRYDYAISTEVLEHIEDPVSFLRNIRKCLTAKGSLLLTTPDKAAIHITRFSPTDMSLLSPGMHTVLFTEQSVKKAVALSGFGYVQVKKNTGTLYVICSNEPIAAEDLFTINVFRLNQYYHRLYDLAPAGSSLQKGIFYRLFRSYVDQGKYNEAIRFLKGNKDFYIIEENEINNIHTEQALTKFYSLNDSINYFYCGIVYMNYTGKYEKAEKLFYLSYLSCHKRLTIIPQFSIVDADIIWQSKLHQGIANMHHKNPIKAARCFLEIMDYKGTVPHIPLPGDDTLKKAIGLYKDCF